MKRDGREAKFRKNGQDQDFRGIFSTFFMLQIDSVYACASIEASRCHKSVSFRGCYS